MAPPNLSVNQHAVLRRLLASWCDTSEWPKRLKFDLQLQKEGIDLRDVLDSLPCGVVRSDGTDQGRVSLSVAGLELAGAPRGDIDPFLQLVRLGIQRLLENPYSGTTVSHADLAIV